VKQQPPNADDGVDYLARYRDGDPTAFRNLVDQFKDRLLQFFYRLCWDRARAEDLTQDLFLKLMQGSRRYQPEGRLATFVYRVATNLWIDHYRAQRPQRRMFSLDQVFFEPIDVSGSEPGPVDVAAMHEDRARLRRALESLTEPHRIVFELAVYQERPYQEISDLLGIPVGTVKSRMHNTILALKKLLATGDAETDERRADENHRPDRGAQGR
jgi:RNA polymerase sigma-70 factor (ECF subfamily)